MEGPWLGGSPPRWVLIALASTCGSSRCKCGCSFSTAAFVSALRFLPPSLAAGRGKGAHSDGQAS
eukprot:682522-Prymnesium_polylepis.1